MGVIVCGWLCTGLALAPAFSPFSPSNGAGAQDADSGGAAPVSEVEPEDRRVVSGLIGSKHDFSTDPRHPRDMCLPCHTPHLPVPAQPLPAEPKAAAQGIPPYTAAGVDLSGGSLLCLSCHDGLIAPDVFTSSHSTRLASQLGASQLGYGGLRGHPVGVLYPVSDPNFRAAAGVTADGKIKLPDGRIQCTSCHDPHNTDRHPRLLVKSNRRSALCLSCHRK